MSVTLGVRPRDYVRKIVLADPAAVQAVAFTGTGLNDATSGGTPTSAPGTAYTVIIDAVGTPDTFKWKKGSGSFTTGVAITGAAQNLSGGVQITFAATAGHTLGDQWLIGVGAYTHIQAQRDCDVVEVYLDPEDANQQSFLVKHRSDDPAEQYETVAPTQQLLKNSWKSRFRMTSDLPYRIQLRDTIGFFSATVGGTTPTLVVKEITDPTRGTDGSDAPLVVRHLP